MFIKLVAGRSTNLYLFVFAYIHIYVSIYIYMNIFIFICIYDIFCYILLPCPTYSYSLLYLEVTDLMLHYVVLLYIISVYFMKFSHELQSLSIFLT